MRKMLSAYWITIIIFAFSILVLPWKLSFERDAWITFQFILIGIIAGVEIVRESRR